MMRFMLVALIALAAGACPVDTQCDCVACQNAVTLSVFDEDEDTLTDWSMEATVNGNTVDDLGACDAGTRGANNTCSFGTELGVYHIIIRAPGFDDKEVAARFAAKTGQNCCQQCISNAVVDVFMHPSVSP